MVWHRIVWLRKDRKYSRQSDDDEVEPVPGVTQEREVGKNESSSEDLRQTFGRVDRRENFPAPRTHRVHTCAGP